MSFSCCSITDRLCSITSTRSKPRQNSRIAVGSSGHGIATLKIDTPRSAAWLGRDAHGAQRLIDVARRLPGDDDAQLLLLARQQRAIEPVRAYKRMRSRNLERAAGLRSLPSGVSPMRMPSPPSGMTKSVGRTLV
jgi:hypothetical protein